MMVCRIKNKNKPLIKARIRTITPKNNKLWPKILDINSCRLNPLKSLNKAMFSFTRSNAMRIT